MNEQLTQILLNHARRKRFNSQKTNEFINDFMFSSKEDQHDFLHQLGYYQEGGYSSAPVVVEQGEVMRDMEGNIQEVNETAPSHDDSILSTPQGNFNVPTGRGGVMLNGIESVLSDSQSQINTGKRKNNSKDQIIKIKPKEAENIGSQLGLLFKPSKSLSPSELFRQLRDIRDKKSEKLLKALDGKRNDKISETSKAVVAAQVSALPDDDMLYDLAFGIQEEAKEGEPEFMEEQTMQYGGNNNITQKAGDFVRNWFVNRANARKGGLTPENIEGVDKLVKNPIIVKPDNFYINPLMDGQYRPSEKKAYIYDKGQTNAQKELIGIHETTHAWQDAAVKNNKNAKLLNKFKQDIKNYRKSENVQLDYDIENEDNNVFEKVYNIITDKRPKLLPKPSRPTLVNPLAEHTYPLIEKEINTAGIPMDTSLPKDYYDYLKKPIEVHARLMELRRDMGLKPDQDVTKEQLQNFIKSGKKKSYYLDQLKEILDDRGILNLLNKTAANQIPTDNTYVQYGGSSNGVMLPEIVVRGTNPLQGNQIVSDATRTKFSKYVKEPVYTKNTLTKDPVMQFVPILGSGLDVVDAVDAFEKGDISNGLWNSVAAVAGIIPGGRVGSTIAKNAIKGINALDTALGLKELINTKQQGGAVTRTGYLNNSPDRFNNYNIIPDNYITMDNVDTPLLLMGDGGEVIHAMPNSGKYYLPNSKYVMEIPYAQRGWDNDVRELMGERSNLRADDFRGEKKAFDDLKQLKKLKKTGNIPKSLTSRLDPNNSYEYLKEKAAQEFGENADDVVEDVLEKGEKSKFFNKLAPILKNAGIYVTLASNIKGDVSPTQKPIPKKIDPEIAKNLIKQGFPIKGEYSRNSLNYQGNVASQDYSWNQKSTNKNTVKTINGGSGKVYTVTQQPDGRWLEDNGKEWAMNKDGSMYVVPSKKPLPPSSTPKGKKPSTTKPASAPTAQKTSSSDIERNIPLDNNEGSTPLYNNEGNLVGYVPTSAAPTEGIYNIPQLGKPRIIQGNLTLPTIPNAQTVLANTSKPTAKNEKAKAKAIVNSNPFAPKWYDVLPDMMNIVDSYNQDPVMHQQIDYPEISLQRYNPGAQLQAARENFLSTRDMIADPGSAVGQSLIMGLNKNYQTNLNQILADAQQQNSQIANNELMQSAQYQINEDMQNNQYDKQVYNEQLQTQNNARVQRDLATKNLSKLFAERNALQNKIKLIDDVFGENFDYNNGTIEHNGKLILFNTGLPITATTTGNRKTTTKTKTDKAGNQSTESTITQDDLDTWKRVNSMMKQYGGKSKSKYSMRKC